MAKYNPSKIKVKDLIPILAPGTKVVLNDFIHKKECSAEMLNSLQDNVKNFEVSKLSVMKDKKDSVLVAMLNGYIICGIDTIDKFYYICDGGYNGCIIKFEDGSRFSFLKSTNIDDTTESDWLFNLDDAIKLKSNLNKMREDLGFKLFAVANLQDVNDAKEIEAFIRQYIESCLKNNILN